MNIYKMDTLLDLNFFPKSDFNLIDSETKLLDYLNNNPDAKKQYIHNQSMINFTNIPKKYVDKIMDSYNKILI